MRVENMCERVKSDHERIDTSRERVKIKIPHATAPHQSGHLNFQYRLKSKKAFSSSEFVRWNRKLFSWLAQT